MELFILRLIKWVTYIERTGERLEQTLRDAIDTPGQIVSLVGPSKSGKTVLVEKVIGTDSLITVTGAGIKSPDDIWDRVLDWIEAPTTQTKGSTTSGTVGAGATATGSTSLLGLAKAKGKVSGDVAIGHEREKSIGFERAGLAQIVKEIGNSDFVILVDDFHYMPSDVQSEAAKTLKEHPAVTRRSRRAHDAIQTRFIGRRGQRGHREEDSYETVAARVHDTGPTPRGRRSDS